MLVELWQKKDSKKLADRSTAEGVRALVVRSESGKPLAVFLQRGSEHDEHVFMAAAGDAEFEDILRSLRVSTPKFEVQRV